ncbi:hypothetical protein COK56_01520 [Bacillus cereus]|uniref:hypothetical protein n=1 Tax=Bacillus cereus TaxID=1396 RepID=UPI000BEC15E0|nr:hypothetical protein [Bacillus cereus]PEC54168.1 hypothetical protein CON05_12300 [Bacillus cereus]PFE42656.1 hypothetical protein CN317_23585 [Bacillus cereus]PFN15986.1 hypothetical protein COJ72_03690 [Bacillus cereus]PFS85148.1 hypothetical protein COK56_01520 [Bacillus cereus]
MSEEYPNYELPNKEQRIWRYMDFTKFMSMLDKEEIYFTRSDKFIDKFEGTFPKANQAMRPLMYRGIVSPENQEILFAQQDKVLKYYREFVTINCWHMNDYESAAMWDLYLKSNEGIAIQSNVGRLIESFESCPEEIRFGEVKYRDFNIEPVRMNAPMDMFIYKRKSFEHEREIRAIHKLPFKLAKEGWVDDEAESPVKHGLGISCDIRVLIERVYISPTAPIWFEELVRSMCDKFNLNRRVFKSELSELPY